VKLENGIPLGEHASDSKSTDGLSHSVASGTKIEASVRSRDLAATTHLTSEQLAEDASFSVAGEEDPGAALDLVGPTTGGPEAWCTWPRERSA
jgi:hypothetical protein